MNSVENYPFEFNDITSNDYKSLKNAYDEYGCVVIRNFVHQDRTNNCHSEISKLIQLGINKANPSPETDALLPLNRFDSGMINLVNEHRNIASEIFNTCKKLISINSLTLHSKFVDLSRVLMTTELPAIYTRGTNVRADHPSEDERLYPWHQDYLYNLGSKDGITFWTPLVDVDDENGCLLVAPKSHKEGLLPVVSEDPTNENKNSSKSFSIFNIKNILKRYSCVSIPMKVGDIIAFGGDFLHSSQQNRSDGTRWSVQFRYINLLNADSVRMGWPGGMAEGINFESYHPELIIKH